MSDFKKYIVRQDRSIVKFIAHFEYSISILLSLYIFLIVSPSHVQSNQNFCSFSTVTAFLLSFILCPCPRYMPTRMLSAASTRMFNVLLGSELITNMVMIITNKVFLIICHGICKSYNIINPISVYIFPIALSAIFWHYNIVSC